MSSGEPKARRGAWRRAPSSTDTTSSPTVCRTSSMTPCSSAAMIPSRRAGPPRDPDRPLRRGRSALGVQPALLLREIRPAPGARVLARLYLARAGPAADAGVVPVVQDVVRDVVGADVVPDLLPGPLRQRVQLHQVEQLVPLHQSGVGAGRRLVAADAGDPGLEAAEVALERLHLADLAAEVGLPAVEIAAVLGRLLLDRHERFHADDPYAVLLHDAVADLEGLLEEVVGVEIEDRHRPIDPRDHVDQRHVLRAEAAGQGDAVAELLDPPPHQLLGAPLLELLRDPLKLAGIDLRHGLDDLHAFPPPRWPAGRRPEMKTHARNAETRKDRDKQKTHCRWQWVSIASFEPRRAVYVTLPRKPSVPPAAGRPYRPTTTGAATDGGAEHGADGGRAVPEFPGDLAGETHVAPSRRLFIYTQLGPGSTRFHIADGIPREAGEPPLHPRRPIVRDLP